MTHLRTAISFGLAAAVLALSAGPPLAGEPASQPASADWPQYCGPNRDCIAVNSPKLIDTWPKDGPPLAWKSEWIPGFWQGGCSGPVVADGKVFVYSTWHHPVGGGKFYKILTPEVLAYWGWIPDLPDDLAGKIEAARISKDKPPCKDWYWWASNLTDHWAWEAGEFKDFNERMKEVDAYLAKKPELDRYIKGFLATLDPKDAKKYGDAIKNRLCITTESSWGHYNGLTWDQLVKLSKLQGAEFATLSEWAAQIKIATGVETFAFHYHELKQFIISAWMHSYTRADTLVCLDAATGKTVWKKDFQLDLDAKALKKADDSGGGTGRVLGISGTPTVSGGECYFTGLAGLYCVSAKDGTPVWQAKCPASHSSVLVANGVVYCDGSAFQADTGRLLWKNPKDPGGAAASAGRWACGGKTCVIAPVGSTSISCLELETGNALWTLKIPSALVTVFALNGDTLIVTGRTYKMTATGTELLKTLADSPGAMVDTDRVVYQGYIYAGIGISEGAPKGKAVEGLCCFDLTSGELKWSYRGPTYSEGFTPSILADGKIIMSFIPGGWRGWPNGNNGVTMIKATPEKYVLLGSFSPGLISWTPMSLADGRLYIRTEVGISCYDLRAERK